MSVLFVQLSQKLSYGTEMSSNRAFHPYMINKKKMSPFFLKIFSTRFQLIRDCFHHW
jgi:hypothetical protein